MSKNKKEFFLIRWFKRMFLGARPELSMEEEEKIQTPMRQMISNFTHKPLAMTGLIVFLAIFAFVMIGPKYWVLDLSEQDATLTNLPPSNNMMDVPQAMLDAGVADIAAGNFQRITELCAEARKALLGYEVAHVGINTESNDDAQAIAAAFGSAFGFAAKDGNSSVFASSGIEVMKSRYLGAQGHLAVRTNRMDIAIAEMEKKGLTVDMSTAKYKGDKIAAVYLKDEIGGFAIHLVNK